MGNVHVPRIPYVHLTYFIGHTDHYNWKLETSVDYFFSILGSPVIGWFTLSKMNAENEVDTKKEI